MANVAVTPAVGSGATRALSARTRAVSRSTSIATHRATAQGGTSWRRSILFAVPCVAVAAATGAAVLRGSLPVALSVSQQSFALSAEVAHADGALALAATSGSSSSSLTASNVRLDHACVVITPLVGGLSSFWSFTVSVPTRSIQLRDLNVGSAAVAAQSGTFDATDREPLQLATAFGTSGLGTGHDFGVLTGPATTLGNLTMSATSSSLSTTMTASDIHLGVTTHRPGAMCS